MQKLVALVLVSPAFSLAPGRPPLHRLYRWIGSGLFLFGYGNALNTIFRFALTS
ncbi:hypothetical protein L218DRAFT_960128 [Marasmius fiardii PR-910]|nr:hypothetical protein L218DRAFT_960128 [Marasmius fiardii PR-910]